MIRQHPVPARPTAAFVGASWVALVIAVTAFGVGLWNADMLLSENQSVYIPLGAVHRMENPGKVPMVLIEVQTGPYLGEDDIIRYEDIYARD